MERSKSFPSHPMLCNADNQSQLKARSGYHCTRKSVPSRSHNMQQFNQLRPARCK